MRLSNLLEAPIADIAVHDFTNRDTQQELGDASDVSYSAPDRKLIRSKRGQEKIIRAFKLTPFVFKVHFVETNHLDGSDKRENERADVWSRSYSAGIHDTYDYGDGEIKGEQGVITVVMMANLSEISNKIPMTGWILAHKIGHSFQDHMHNTGWETGPILNTIHKANEVIARISGSTKSTRNFDPARGTEKHLTMRSAREGNLDNPFEIFPELMAQYLVNGEITLRPDVDPRIAPMLNKLYHKLLEQLVGKVVVEI